VTFPSRATPEFWKLYRHLPPEARNLARKNYQLWREEPFHPSLNFKKIGRGKWSVRVGIHYRAVGKFEGSSFVWDWIGTHGEYDRLA
jgi:hypothetical protein